MTSGTCIQLYIVDDGLKNHFLLLFFHISHPPPRLTGLVLMHQHGENVLPTITKILDLTMHFDNVCSEASSKHCNLDMAKLQLKLFKVRKYLQLTFLVSLEHECVRKFCSIMFNFIIFVFNILKCYCRYVIMLLVFLKNR